MSSSEGGEGRLWKGTFWLHKDMCSQGGKGELVSKREGQITQIPYLKGVPQSGRKFCE